MAISTYTELKNAVINWSHRSDLDLLVPDFIRLAEEEMYNNPVQQLRIYESDTTSTLTASTSSRFLSLPTDYAEMRNIRFDIDYDSEFLQYRTPEQLNRFDDTDKPQFYTIIGNQIEFDRVPDSAYSVIIQYSPKVTALTSSAPTNTLLTNHSNIYLFGALAQAFIYADDMEKQAKYEAKFIQAIIGANKAAKRAKLGAAPSMKVEGSTP